MKRLSTGICAVLLLVSTVAAASGPVTKPRTGVLNGNGVPAPSLDVGTNGQCNVSRWVDVCPSGNCNCVEVTSATATGSLNQGRQDVSNFFVTIDQGSNPATEPQIVNGPSPSCNLVFGVVTLTSQTTGQAITLNLEGTSCKHVIGISANNPSGKHDKDLLLGGWGISNDPVPSPNDASGWGTFTGTVINGSNAAAFKLSGDVTQ